MKHWKYLVQLIASSTKMQIFYCVFLALHLTITSSSPTPEIQSSRVINGYAVDIQEVPYHAALKQRVGAGWAHFCGAALVSNRAALTAAHCVSSFLSAPSSLRITVGTAQRAAGGKNYDISRVRSHEYYDRDTLVNDIAMLITAKAITFGKTVDKVPFAPKEFDLPAGTEALVTGFGLTENEGTASPSSILLGAHVRITEQETCARAYTEITTISPGMICANATNPPRDACQGDSGGPLVARGHLVGIVSWGEGCADEYYPGVYTRVSEYASWVLERLD